MSVVEAMLADGVAAVERRFQEAARAAMEQPAGRIALVLHLSRLRPPTLKPYHRRIALSLLQDVAARHDGQVFALANTDLVLLCQVTKARRRLASAAVPQPEELPGVLGRLLRVDDVAMADLVSYWPLEQAVARLRDYAQARARSGEAVMLADADPGGQGQAIDAMAGLIGTASLADLMHSQTAITLEPGLSVAGGGLYPLFREVGFSIAGLEARAGGGGGVYADPFLFRHLAVRLDQRMLEVLQREIGRGGALDVLRQPGPAGEMPPVLHLNLTLAGVLSPSCDRLLAAIARKGANVAVEISLIEALTDPPGFLAARRKLARAASGLVLDGVSHLAMLLSRPWLLQADMLKLDWSPRLLELAAHEQQAMGSALAQAGPQRIVLHRAETEAALRWGMARGIRRFQGRYVDAMLGAARIVSCPAAAACTLRQCIERATATARAGRAGCGNPGLLNAGAPMNVPVPAPALPVRASAAPPPYARAEAMAL
jgi:hypothetical protein